MNSIHFCRQLLLILFFAALVLPALAQATSPVVDPSFAALNIYTPTRIRVARQLSDGSKIVLPDALLRVDGQAATASTVAKFTAAGSYDAAASGRFGANTYRPFIIQEAPGNKVVVLNNGSHATLPRLTRLNDDGSVDNTFAVTLTGTVTAILVQADGKIVVGGSAISINGQPVSQLVRLNANGTPDTAFAAALGAGPDGLVRVLALAPTGGLVVGGSFDNVSGQALPALVQLTPSGAIDSSVVPALNTATDVMALAVQPDGKLLLAGKGSPLIVGTFRMVRLLVTGAIDASFSTATQFILANPKSDNPAILVQPNGRILVNSVTGAYGGSVVGSVYRLLPDGTLDTSFHESTTYHRMSVGSNVGAVSMQLLSSGQLLTAGTPASLPGGGSAASTRILNADGTTSPTFAPVLLQAGNIQDMVLQPDGKIIIGGDFTEINGSPARYLARLQASGLPDAAFTTNSLLDEQAVELELQPDGKLLVGGYFNLVGTALRPSPGIVRLLASGLPDNTFVSSINLVSPEARNIALQPDGKMVVYSVNGFTGTSSNGFGRLLPNGQFDASFSPPLALAYPYALALQPDGRILVGAIYNGGAGNNSNIVRLLADGTLDSAFNLTATNLPSANAVNTITLYPDGRILAGGFFTSFGSVNTQNMVRLLANGTPDPSFTTTAALGVASVTIQPNSRLLLADFTGQRLLLTGALDNSFGAGAVSFGIGVQTQTKRWIVQPDGKLLVCGYFEQIAGASRLSIARLLDPNVLHVSNQQAAAHTEAYPIPAHDELHLSLDPAARPRQVQLLDAQGRAVLTQAVSQPSLTLATAALPAGLYLLRVDYAEGGPVTRRVVIE